ncbi:MAG: Mlc titration factor MtfA (ptsG expression regulator) [Glaciecola sp.]|jgi:Mlc titration factor MtfA (ptsG expression regulator)
MRRVTVDLFDWARSPSERRLRTAIEDPFPGAWAALLRRTWVTWQRLDHDDRRLMEQLTAGFLATIEVEQAQGFTVTEPMRVVIAAQASLLVLGLARAEGPREALRAFGDVRTVIVHPTTVVTQRERPTQIQHVVTRAPMHLLGQAELYGPVLLAWDAVLEGLQREDGENVVLHEFAHKLDMRDGSVDGTPGLGDRESRRAWHEAATRTLRLLRVRRDPILRHYGAQNPAEFFAVATETFFERPHELREHHPALYSALEGLYLQDPASLALPVTT